MASDQLPLSPEVVKLDTQISDYQHQIRSITASRIGGFGFAAVLTVTGISLIVAAVTLRSDGFQLAAIVVSAVALVSWLAVADVTSGSVEERRLLTERLRLVQIKRADYLAGKTHTSQTVRSRYREDIPDLVAKIRRRAATYQRLYVLMQSVVIVGALTSSAVTALFAGTPRGRLGAVFLTLLVGVCASGMNTFRIREKGENVQMSANAIEKEYRLCGLRLGEYSDLDEPSRLRLLAERVESVREAQAERERELNQPPAVRQATGMEGP